LLFLRFRPVPTHGGVYGVKLHQLQQRALRGVDGIVELCLLPRRIKVCTGLVTCKFFVSSKELIYFPMDVNL
jgi:hypothetical protein